MSHTFQICPIDFILHGEIVPYAIFSFKITEIINISCILHTIGPSTTIFLFDGTGIINYYWVLLLYVLYFIL